MNELSKAGKEEFALAILLWKDFKCAGRFEPDITMQALMMAKHLGVMAEFNSLMTQLPPMKIEPR